MSVSKLIEDHQAWLKEISQAVAAAAADAGAVKPTDDGRAGKLKELEALLAQRKLELAEALDAAKRLQEQILAIEQSYNRLKSEIEAGGRTPGVDFMRAPPPSEK